MSIEWRPVTSTSVAEVGHDGQSLHVRFRSGAVYSFADVTRQQFEDLLAAKSVGKHFNQHFRGKPFTKKEAAAQER
jgi:hypothetical protein